MVDSGAPEGFIPRPVVENPTLTIATEAVMSCFRSIPQRGIGIRGTNAAEAATYPQRGIFAMERYDGKTWFEKIDPTKDRILQEDLESGNWERLLGRLDITLRRASTRTDGDLNYADKKTIPAIVVFKNPGRDIPMAAMPNKYPSATTQDDVPTTDILKVFEAQAGETREEFFQRVKAEFVNMRFS